MKKKYIVLAASLLALGLILFGGAMTMLKWNFSRFTTTKYETVTHDLTEDFQNIKIESGTADVVFLPAEGDTCTVICEQEKKIPFTVTVADGTLKIERNDLRKWYEYISIGFRSPKITVALPKGEYDALAVKANTGDATIKDISFGTLGITARTGDVTVENAVIGALDVSLTTGRITLSNVTADGIKTHVSTGKTFLTNVKANSLSSDGSTGDLTMTDTVISGKLSVERSTGDVRFTRCDAGEIEIKADTGDVDCSFLTEKVIFATTDTGKVDIPQSTVGGKCVIETDTGDIKVVFEK